jgi:uncharacterized membrane protein YdbT with pleckstrin-like domain
MAAAMAAATFGFAVLGGITLAVLLAPEELRIGHYILGSITGLLTLAMYPWQILDTKTRKHVLTSNGVAYRCGVLSRFEVEVPYGSIQAVTVRQSILQRMCGCGDVRVSAHGVSDPFTISQQGMNSVCIRSIKDFAEVARLLREKIHSSKA